MLNGDVEDGWPAAGDRTVIVSDTLDVGMPPSFGAVSGWDIKDVRFHHDGASDRLYVGINCFGICGDADGNGDPS